MQTTIIFDIESGPLPEDQIRPLMPPFEAPGNIKDPEKIAAAIKAKQDKWIEQAALSAITGKVLCVGVLIGPEFRDLGARTPNDEKALLEAFWLMARTAVFNGDYLVGFCCKMFDLPFLVRRSWALGVQVPPNIWDGRYFSDHFIDIAEKWECGVRGCDHISLDQLSKFLGVGQKNGEGKDFAALWESDRQAALAYLQNDLQLTKRAYERMMQ